MIWIIALSFMLALVAPVIGRTMRGGTGAVLALWPVVCVAQLLRYLPMEAGEVHDEVYPWIPQLGISLAFRLDGLSAMFALLILGIGALVLLYTGGYLGKSSPGGFCGYILGFMGSMLGVVLADDLITLLVFWELTSVTSYLLIGYKHEKKSGRDAALCALLVTGGGGLALMAGLILLTLAAGDLGMPAELAGRISALQHVDLSSHGFYVPALLLILLGAFTKSAQVPFHFWLPRAMAAPTPASAYLHSATMVKAGVYLLARLHPALGDTAWWHVLVTFGGAATMLAAAALTLAQYDLKRILAYSTVSILGALVMLLGIGTTQAIKACVVFLVAHALYKAALFLVAGNLDHATGARDVRRLGGLFRIMPATAIAGLLAALSMAGAPPMVGFVGKEMLLKAKLDLDTLGLVLIVVASVANVFLVAMALVVAVWPFFGRRKLTKEEPHEVRADMLVGPLLLAGLSLGIGLLPHILDENIGTAAASAIVGEPVKMELKLWHGVNPTALTALAISAVTLALGFGLFMRLHDWLGHTRRAAQVLGVWGPAALYDRVVGGLPSASAAISRTIQSGYLRRYLLATLAVLVVAVGIPLVQLGITWESVPREAPSLIDVMLVALAAIGAIATTRTPSRLSGVAYLGITGLAVALIFTLYSAPDLALTQIMVESLTVILLVLVFYHLPRLSDLRVKKQRRAHAGLGAVIGAGMALLLLATTTLEMERTVSEYYVTQSVPQAQGRNVVNVILVDYRALDTFGEITVLALAGMGVYALLRLRPVSKPGEPGEPHE